MKPQNRPGHPGHQRVLAKRATALGIAVNLRGWRLTELRHLDTWSMSGPCALCRTACVRYGPQGNPLCRRCAVCA